MGSTGRAISKAASSAGKSLKRLFTGPEQIIEGDRLENFDVQQADEGDPIARCFGLTLRANGTLIWVGTLEDVTTSTKVRSKGANVRQVEHTNFLSVAVAICEGPIGGLAKIFADSKIFWDASNPGGENRYDNLYIHTGQIGQAPDPLIQAALGANQTPGFSGIAYVVIERLNLTNFGGRLPVFSFEMNAETSGAISAGGVIERLALEASVSSSEIDVTGATKTVRGMLLNRPESVSRSIERLVLSHEVRARETNGVMEFFNKGDEEVVEVDASHLGARQASQQSAGRKLLEIDDGTDEDEPREVNVQYYDVENEFNKGSIKARRAIDKGIDKQEINLPIVLTAVEAREIAERRLWESWNERQPIKIQLPPQYLNVQETDIIVFSVAGTKYRCRVIAVSRGFNFLFEVEAVIQSTSVDDTVDPPFLVIVNPPADPTDPFQQTLYQPPTLVAHVLDLPALRPQEISLVGFIYGHTTQNVADAFLTVDYFERFGTTTDFSFLFVDDDLSTIGIALTELAEPQNPHHWDEASTVDVQLYREGQTLESAPDKLSVLQGQNWCLLGGEIIGFRTATLIGVRQYRLSGLIRGRRDTTDHTDSHALGERFVLLSTVTYQEQALSDIGAARNMKIVPEGEDIDNIAEFAYTPQGESLRPFRPAHIKGSRDGSDNLTISWIPRTREFYRSLSMFPFPPLELQEKFEIDILDGLNVVRTLTATTATSGQAGSVVYSAAEQTTDFGSAQSSVSVRVYKISSVAGIGRGNPGEATI